MAQMDLFNPERLWLGETQTFIYKTTEANALPLVIIPVVGARKNYLTKDSRKKAEDKKSLTDNYILIQ